MLRLFSGVLTAFVLVVVGAGAAQASQGVKSHRPLDNYVKHCVQFGGYAGSDGASASCLFVPEDRYAQLGKLCAAGGGTYAVIPASGEGTTTRLECRLA